MILSCSLSTDECWQGGHLPARSPDLNAYSESSVLSIESGCLDRIIPLGEEHECRTPSAGPVLGKWSQGERHSMVIDVEQDPWKSDIHPL